MLPFTKIVLKGSGDPPVELAYHTKVPLAVTEIEAKVAPSLIQNEGDESAMVGAVGNVLTVTMMGIREEISVQPTTLAPTKKVVVDVNTPVE